MNKNTVLKGLLKHLLPLFLSFLIALSLPAQLGSRTLAANGIDFSDVGEIARKYGAVGVEVAVIGNGEVVDTYAYGDAVKNVLPMTADTKMRIASISKIVLGMTAMSLQEEGKLNIDADISDYWGVNIRNPRYKSTPITMRYIMSHTSSISVLDDGYNANGATVKSRLASGSYFTGTTPGAIGSWNYNNYGFAVLGLTVEVAANETINSAARRNLFDPLGIDAAYGAAYLSDNSNLATIYRNGSSVGLSADSQRNTYGGSYPGESGYRFAGGLVISARDLGKLVAVLANDGEYNGVRVLSESSVKLMETSQGYHDDFEQCLPLRHRYNTYNQSELYYHTGSAYGVFNLMSYNPVTRNGIVVLTSGASGAKDKHGIYKICGEISDCLYDRIPVLTASPITSAVLVNGEAKFFDAYTIEGSSYFKLRDLAYVLNGTSSQFNPIYDAGKKAIILLKAEPYIPDGGELSGKGREIKIPKLSYPKVLLDGKQLSLGVYKINDSNYFKLGDLSEALGFDVTWNRDHKTISINTSAGYAAQEHSFGGPLSEANY